MSKTPISFISPQRELEIVNALMNTSNNIEFKRGLILSGYTTDKSIVELLIRTSSVKNGLLFRLLKTGFDVNINNILIGEKKRVTVNIIRKSKSDLIIHGYFRS
jgi:hypothetical protein